MLRVNPRVSHAARHTRVGQRAQDTPGGGGGGGGGCRRAVCSSWSSARRGKEVAKNTSIAHVGVWMQHGLAVVHTSINYCCVGRVLVAQDAPPSKRVFHHNRKGTTDALVLNSAPYSFL